ncbi:hypothetical protein T492DRAFT_886114 [Pavlovales sp. CCMP2436]|nr:hypothetical protein T492DRAFT_886114 [Pavlovales sp. CCMP2436]
MCAGELHFETSERQQRPDPVDLPNAANVKVGDIVHAPRFTISGRDKVMKEHGNRLDARPVSGILVDGSIVSKGKTLTFSTAATEITYVIEGLQINVTVPMALLVFEMDDQLFKFDRTTGHHSMELTSQESGARASWVQIQAFKVGCREGACNEMSKTFQGMNDILKSNAVLLQSNADTDATKARTDERNSKTRMYEVKAMADGAALQLAQFKAAKKDDVGSLLLALSAGGPSGRGVRDEPLYDY